MKWSWKVGEISKIGIYVHASFALLLAWVAMGQLTSGQHLSGAFEAIGFTLAVFGVIVLHELGHALTARHFGIDTRDITLYPIGGVASLERTPRNPIQELLIALAGPAVNVVLAVGLLLVLVLTTQAPFAAPVDLFVLPFVAKLMWVNVGLAVFNLIPAFPMDGGRVLRAALAMRFNYATATHLAARVGRVLAVGLGVLGLYSNPFLVMIAIFVWFAATAEELQVDRPPGHTFTDQYGRLVTITVPSRRYERG